MPTTPEQRLRQRGEGASSPIARALASHTATDADRDTAHAVASILADLGMDDDVIVAAVLYYMPNGDLEAVRKTFGEPVVRLMQALTGMQAINEYSAATHAAASTPEQADRLKSLLLTMASDVRVVIVLLAKRLHAMRCVRQSPSAERTRMARETLELYAPLASRLGIAQFKWEMEDLSFRELESDVYMSLAKQLAQRRTERESYIQRVVDQIQNKLIEHGIKADVTGRAKHLYSIWKKMQQKTLSFDQVFDARATRVLVDDVAACYSALGVVHSLWKHVAKEFDDYIANPKPNGYQSLHTAVIGPEGRTLEVQIRTREMNANAEFGVAAHWRYKERAVGVGDDAAESAAARVNWRKQILEVREDGGSSSDFIGRFNAELLRDRVYAVTPQGRILDLPAGATPLDFAYQVHTELGHRCRGAKINGKMVPLTTPLRSGDRVEVLTTRNATPSRDWLSTHLGYLATSRARAKVRHWFKHRDHAKNAAAGNDIFQRELRRLNVGSADQDRLTKRFNYQRFYDFLAGVGCGDVSAAQIASALQHGMPPRPAQPKVVAASKRHKRHKRPPRGLQIQGVGNLVTQMARCCHPLPGDDVVGFVTRGRGVTIHRRDCANVLRMDTLQAQRLLEITWARDDQDTYGVNVLVRAFDRKGLLQDVTTVLAGEGVDINAMSSASIAPDQTAKIQLTIQVTSLEHLSRVLDRVSQLSNVFEARRTE